MFKDQQRKLMANEKTATVNDPNNPDKVQPIISQDPNKDPHRLKKMVTFVPEKALQSNQG
jgi:hypothetical protein